MSNLHLVINIELTHKEFVEAYNSGGIKVKIDESAAFKLMDADLMDRDLIDKPSQYAHIFWSCIWILSIAIGIVIFIRGSKLIGAIVVIMGLMLPKAMKRSSSEPILKKALSDESFYNTMIQHQVLIIKEKINVHRKA